MDFQDFINYLYDDPYSYPERRYLRDAENPLEFYNNLQFQRRYRFKKETVINMLLPLLCNDMSLDSNRGLPIPPIIQIIIALRFYATGNFQIVCGDLHKISQSVTSKIISNISKRLALKVRQFIHFPTPAQQNDTKQKFYRIAGFPGVLGCIDCTHIPIKNPGRHNGEVFRNRKGWFSINVQIICGPGMQIYDIVVRWPGSVHDSRIFANSRCCMKFEDRELSGILIGDSGYAQTSYMFTPISNPQTQPETRYNRAQIMTRNVIERLNGVWKRRFPCLSRKLQNNLFNTCYIIVACAVLHNIALITNENMEDESTDEIQEVPVSHINETERGSLIRAAFIRRHFT